MSFGHLVQPVRFVIDQVNLGVSGWLRWFLMNSGRLEWTLGRLRRTWMDLGGHDHSWLHLACMDLSGLGGLG